MSGKNQAVGQEGELDGNGWLLLIKTPAKVNIFRKNGQHWCVGQRHLLVCKQDCSIINNNPQALLHPERAVNLRHGALDRRHS